MNRKYMENLWYTAVLRSDWMLVNFLERFITFSQHPGFVSPPLGMRDSWACSGEFSC